VTKPCIGPTLGQAKIRNISDPYNTSCPAAPSSVFRPPESSVKTTSPPPLSAQDKCTVGARQLSCQQIPRLGPEEPRSLLYLVGPWRCSPSPTNSSLAQSRRAKPQTEDALRRVDERELGLINSGWNVGGPNDTDMADYYQGGEDEMRLDVFLIVWSYDGWTPCIRLYQGQAEWPLIPSTTLHSVHYTLYTVLRDIVYIWRPVATVIHTEYC
jgi:hypothetical protein